MSGKGAGVINPLYLYLAIALWTSLSIVLLVRLRVFAVQPLAVAPPRRGGIHLGHFAACYLLYLAMGMVIGSALLLSKPAAATTTTIATTQNGTATAPASKPEPTSEQKVERGKQSVVIDTAAKIPAVAMIFFLAYKLIEGGLAGFGVAGSQIFRGVRYGMTAFVITMPLVLVVQVIVEVMSRILRHGEAAPRHNLLMLLSEPSADSVLRVLIVFAAVISAPIAEELFFRGMLQTSILSLMRKVKQSASPTVASRWMSILITGAIFAAIHWNFSVSNPNWEVFAPLMVLATALGYVYERTGNLWSAVTLHAMFNGAQLLMWMLAHE